MQMLDPSEIIVQVDRHEVQYSGWTSNNGFGTNIRVFCQVCSCGWGEWECVGSDEESEANTKKRMKDHQEVLNG